MYYSLHETPFLNCYNECIINGGDMYSGNTVFVALLRVFQRQVSRAAKSKCARLGSTTLIKTNGQQYVFKVLYMFIYTYIHRCLLLSSKFAFSSHFFFCCRFFPIFVQLVCPHTNCLIVVACHCHCHSFTHLLADQK